MEFSIVTPVYNDPRIERALDSVVGQTGVSNVEIIVVDGGSTDKTVEIVRSYEDDLDVLIREPDDGIYDAMNKGIRRATGDVVGVLNADDRYTDGSVLADVENRLRETGADVCYGDLVYVDAEDAIVRYWQSGDFRPRRFYLGWMPPHPTFFVRNEVYERYGLYDIGYRIAADYELMLRYLLKEDVTAAYVDRTLVRMASGGESNQSLRNVARANREVVRAWRENSLAGGWFVPFFKLLRKPFQFTAAR